MDQRAKRWEQLLTTRAPFEVTHLRIVESNVFVPQLIKIPRVLAVVGRHGTGKSLLLRTIEAAFTCTNGDNFPPFVGDEDRWTEEASIEGIVEVTLSTPNGVEVRRVNLSESCERRAMVWEGGAGGSFDVLYGSPLIAFSMLGQLYQEYRHVHQHDGQANEWRLSSAELKALCNILGRRYDNVTVRSADLGDGYEVPYVKAILNSKDFDSASMSQGELWVHYVLSWLLQGNAREANLVLLDEPEAFLATLAHRPFIDEVARKALLKRLQLVVATHSPDVLARFPLDSIRMCVQVDNRIRIIEPESFVQVRNSIGIDTPVRALVLVEDDLAKHLLGQLFAHYDPSLATESEIVSVSGESEVIAGLRVLRRSKRLKILGVLDGDQRPSVPLQNQILFLPGTKSPEEELLSSATSEVSWVAKMMHRSADDVIAAISSCQSLDHQYQLSALARQFGQTESAVIFILVRAWLRKSEIKRSAQKLVRDIRAASELRFD